MRQTVAILQHWDMDRISRDVVEYGGYCSAIYAAHIGADEQRYGVARVQAIRDRYQKAPYHCYIQTRQQAEYEPSANTAENQHHINGHKRFDETYLYHKQNTI